jgi:hypothetical protein
MIDDLVKRLRRGTAGDKERHAAADRIDKLEAALRALKAMHHEGGINDLQERDDRTYFMICDVLEGNND